MACTRYMFFGHDVQMNYYRRLRPSDVVHTILYCIAYNLCATNLNEISYYIICYHTLLTQIEIISLKYNIMYIHVLYIFDFLSVDDRTFEFIMSPDSPLRLVCHRAKTVVYKHKIYRVCLFDKK